MIPACLRLCAALALVIGLASPALSQPHYGDEKYTPLMGQEGKDVIWIPTPDEMVMKMLATARVSAQDIVYDLGAGDGKIAIAAAREFGARAVGIEYNPDMADLARRNVARAGVADKVRIVTGDIFVEDFSEATVLTLYLLPDLNLRLRPTILAMRPGTRVVSHSFDMGDWKPDARIDTRGAHGYYWVVPAGVEGRWTLALPGKQGEARLDLRQSFQFIEGNIEIGGKSYAIEEGRMNGAEMRFFYRQADGTATAFTARVAGNRLAGQLRGADAKPVNLSGRRQ